MSGLKPIILYDIPSITPGMPWSPNTMKTRYCLGYKQLPFTTVWVELPDIAPLLQSKGIAEPPYTLPAIEDPNTGAVVVDSLAIAAYLDATYPETPRVLTDEVHALLDRAGAAFSFHAIVTGTGAGVECDTATGAGAGALVFLILAADRLRTPSKAYYHRTRAARYGEAWATLSDACAGSLEGRAAGVKAGIEVVRGVWRKLAALYDDASEGKGEGDTATRRGPFVLGEAPCMLDFVVAGRVRFVMDGLVGSEIEVVAELEGGRLTRLMENLEKYYTY